jgi:predicted nucleic acid-binding protein
MKKIYFDSSAFAKVFTNEDGSDLAKDIIKVVERGHHNIELIMSIWTINETIAAIDKKAHKIHELSPTESNQIIAAILLRTKQYSKANSGIIFVPLEDEIIKASTVLIHSLHVSADDALHIFTAFAHSCQYFICHDKHMLKADGQIPLAHHESPILNMRIIDITERENIKRELNIDI